MRSDTVDPRLLPLGNPFKIPCSGCIYRLCNSILLLPCVMVYYIVSGVFFMFFWCPCMAINVSVQYNGGLLPGIILLTQCYFHRGEGLGAF